MYSLHIDYPGSEITKKQRQEIIGTALMLDAAIAAEDILYFEDNNQIIKNVLEALNNKDQPPQTQDNILLKIKGQEAFVQPIVNDCMSGLMNSLPPHISKMNIECRHYSVFSKKNYAIPAAYVYQFYKDLALELYASKNDRAYAQYQLILSTFFDNNKDLLGFMRNEPEKSLSQLFSDPQFKTIPGFDEYLSLYDKSLVDLLMLRALDQLKHSKHIIMCAGKSHCKNVRNYLKDLGYTSVVAKINEEKTEQIDEIIRIEVEPLMISQYFEELIK